MVQLYDFTSLFTQSENRRLLRIDKKITCVTGLNVSGTVGKTLVLLPLECELDLAACFSQNIARRWAVTSMIRLHETVASLVLIDSLLTRQAFR